MTRAHGFGRRNARGARKSGFAVACWVALLAPPGVLAGPAEAADVARLEVVGVAPVQAGHSQPPRDRAVRRALQKGVWQTAEDLLIDPQLADPAQIDAALGSDPFAYALRFRIIEDRGPTAIPSIYADTDTDTGTDMDGVENVYSVLVEVHIDRDRVRSRLQSAGMLAAPGGIPLRVRMRLSLEGIDDYRAYARVREALIESLGVRSAVPIEAEVGRMVLEVDSNRSADQLLGPLQQAVAPDWQLVLISIDSTLIRVQVLAGEPFEAIPAGASPTAVGSGAGPD